MSAPGLDHTHDPGRNSWVQSANDRATDFPLQNLPFGVARNESGELSVVVAIGGYALDLRRTAAAGLLDTIDPALLRGPDRLGGLLARPSSDLTALRHALAGILEQGSSAEATIRGAEGMLKPISSVDLVTPTQIGSFTDFFAGIYHARAATRVLTPAAISGRTTDGSRSRTRVAPARSDRPERTSAGPPVSCHSPPASQRSPLPPSSTSN